MGEHFQKLRVGIGHNEAPRTHDKIPLQIYFFFLLMWYA